MSKSNRTHSFDIELATLIGIEKAIIVFNIDYWCTENELKGNPEYFYYGSYWTRESLTSLAKKYPYMKRASISRWINELSADEWVKLIQTKDGNIYQRGENFVRWNAGLPLKSEVSQNEIVSEVSQNETKGAVSKWDDGGCLKMGHNNIDSLLDIDSLNVDTIVADAPNPEPETLKEVKKTKKDTPAPRPAKFDYSGQVAEIVAHLNLKAKSRFRPDTSGTVKNISGRLKQGYTVEDFKTVIDFKCSQWLHDPKMAEYLRPETLFCEKHFEGYLNAANIWVNNGRPAATSPAQQRNQSVKQTQEDLARTVMANRKYYPPIEF